MKSIVLGLVVYDEVNLLPDFLSSLEKELDLLSEIIIVDNHPSQACSLFIRSHSLYKKYNNLFSISFNAENNIAVARAFIVSQSKSDLIAFTDPDCILPPDWLQNLLDNYSALESEKKNSLIFGVAGSSRLPMDNDLYVCLNAVLCSYLGAGRSPQGRRASLIQKSNLKTHPNNPVHLNNQTHLNNSIHLNNPNNPNNQTHHVKIQSLSVDHLPTTNCLLNRESIIALGNFNEKYQLAGEDLDLGLRAKMNKFQMRWFADPCVINKSCNSLSSWARRMFIFGQVQSDLRILVRRYGIRIILCLALCFVFILKPVLIIWSVIIYLLLIVFASLQAVVKKRIAPQKFLYLMLCFFVTHFSYLSGFLWGFLRNFFLKALPPPPSAP